MELYVIVEIKEIFTNIPTQCTICLVKMAK